MKEDALEVAKKTKQEHSMQLNGKFISTDMGIELGWINKRTGEVTKKYLKHKDTLIAKKKRLVAKAEAEKQVKIDAKKKAKAKAEKAVAKTREEKANAKLKAKAKKEREKVREQKLQEAEKAKAEAKKEREAKRLLKLEAKKVEAEELKEERARIRKAKAEAKAKQLKIEKANKLKAKKAKIAEKAKKLKAEAKLKAEKAKARKKAKEIKLKEQAEADAKRQEILAKFQKEAEEAGLPIPKRIPRKKKDAQLYEANDGTMIPSPYDLERRSGYKIIWQVLAERHDEVISNEELHAEVKKRLASDPESAEWYHEKYSSHLDELGMPEEYPVIINAATVMTRPPYNGVNKKNHSIINPISLEGLNQRIIAGTRGIMLKTNVQDRYISKTAKKAMESGQTTSV